MLEPPKKNGSDATELASEAYADLNDFPLPPSPLVRTIRAKVVRGARIEMMPLSEDDIPGDIPEEPVFIPHPPAVKTIRAKVILGPPIEMLPLSEDELPHTE